MDAPNHPLNPLTSLVKEMRWREQAFGGEERFRMPGNTYFSLVMVPML
jgi:hypothetical protein